MKKLAALLTSIAALACVAPAHADRVPSPKFTGGQVTLSNGENVYLDPARCPFGDGQGSFYGVNVMGNTKAAGCWQQQGHIIIVEVRALTNENGVIPFTGPRYVLDVPDSYYR